MSSPSRDNEEPSSSTAPADEGPGSSGSGAEARPPAKRRMSSTVIEISDTDTDDSDVCAVNSYQASADEVKRIRGADYSSSSSSSEYSSDSEASWEDDSILVEDDKADVKAVKAQLNPRANRMDDPKFNPKIKAQELIDRLQLNWKEQKDFKSPEVTLTCEPFRLCLLHDFLENPEMINNIVDDMNTLDWSRKKMDLYEFHQTADLASLTWQRSIRGIYELLKTEVMSWVSAVTGLRLRSVSASCSLYGPGDHLLVHDDLLADRRVAFILYLAPWRPPAPQHAPLENGAGDRQAAEWGGWSRSMGGALQLLARDAAGRPTEVVHSTSPRNNMLAFFKVGHESYHQVEEVLSLELPRLSINGWFHGPEPEDEPAMEPEPPPLELPTPQPPHSDIVVLNQWIEATYMSPRSRMQIQTQMERESEVCLRNLFLPEKVQELMEALEDPDVQWEWVGPADQRRYRRVAGAWLAAGGAHAVRQALLLFSSAAFVRLLGDCTDLALARLERPELQRWGPADYTLLPPRAHYAAPRLDALLYLGAAGALCGGHTTYVAPEDGGAGGAGGAGGGADAALVSVPPAHNALSLVYCDAGAASFRKYVSRLTLPPQRCFYVLSCVYRE
ncbi:prolyl 3-hydroxylase sudestada1 [Trichoplusia ni]|uniref:uS12 prolyl 3-hydroxylase n=1 Tax=Trichoplusia ni TaxID=7111 RepID=A0A7E5W7Z7_TRINI|nr:prolyl 3-hydroxylase sudestada1 [Trichoplusia ni]